MLNFYSLFYKHLDRTTDIYSYKTFTPTESSFGVKFDQDFEDIGLNLSTNVFRYKYFFNDLTNDFTRTGFSLEGSGSLFFEWIGFQRGYEFISRKFSIEEIANKYIKIYEELQGKSINQ